MKYIFSLIVVLGVIVGVFWLLGEYQDKNPAALPPSSPPPPAKSWTRSIVETKSITETPRWTPVPTARPVAPQGPRHRAAVDAAARTARVGVTSYAESGGTVTVGIEWMTDNAAQGGDFLDAMMRLGMRDFDDVAKGQRQAGGRRIFTATYRLKM